jgi:hypothetical protein
VEHFWGNLLKASAASMDEEMIFIAYVLLHVVATVNKLPD